MTRWGKSKRRWTTTTRRCQSCARWATAPAKPELNNIGAVYDSLGEKQKALDYYNQALPIVRPVGDRSGEARTLNNIGAVYDSLGEKQKALDFYNQALRIERAVGDRSGEAITLNNIGRVYDSLGENKRHWTTTTRHCQLCVG